MSEENYKQELINSFDLNTKSDRNKLRPYGRFVTRSTAFVGETRGIALRSRDLQDPGNIGGQSRHIAIVVENIDFSWMVKIGQAFSVDPNFFATYTEQIRGPNKWKTVLGPTDKHRNPAERYNLCKKIERAGSQWLNARYWHIDGIFGHKLMDNTDAPDIYTNRVPRRGSWNEKYGYTRATRISCWMTSVGEKQIRIILVDGSFHIRSSSALHPRLRMQLFLPVSDHRDGMVLPQLYDDRSVEGGMNLHDCLGEFFSHSWQHHLLFMTSGELLTPVSFWHLVAASLWRTNLANLDKHIKYLSLRATRSAQIDTVDSLHDVRVDMETLREQVSATLHEMPKMVKDECQQIEQRRYMRPPEETLKLVDESSMHLEQFLMDTFTLFLSSISIRQSVRAQQLTVLAFIYVPLSFVTGVFGMNIDVINGSPLSIWVVVVTLSVTVVLTLIIYETTELWQGMKMRWADCKRRREQKQRLIDSRRGLSDGRPSDVR